MGTSVTNSLALFISIKKEYHLVDRIQLIGIVVVYFNFSTV